MMKRYFSFLATVLLLPLAMFAQGTTSGSIEGTITDASGEPLPGANIVAIHQPTGTRYGTASRTNGSYTFKSVRVGGPYLVQVTFVGFNPMKKEVPNVELSETVEVNFALEEGALTLDEISVVAEADPIFNADRTGASTNISREEISTTPTISRSLSDFTRLNPQVTSGNSFGGANNRYNNILVDGATLNDVFGLGEGTPGSQAGVQSPISVDAIQEFNVEIAPFDVTNNGFTGGQVNAITKSGTNKFTGTAYYQLRNESFVGSYRTDDGTLSGDYPSFDEKYLGLSIGGPIVEDKLFFFVNGEFKRRSSPLTTGILGSEGANIFPVEQSTFDQISDIAQREYSYNTGGVSLLSQAQDNNKILAKIDWNINQDHKFTFRYNLVDAVDEEGIGRGEDSYSYSNRQYNFNSTQNSYVAELNSSFSNNASNMLRAVYTRIRDSRDVVAQPFPEANVSVFADGDFRSIYMGIDRFSQANSLGQDLIEITDNFTYIQGDHEFTLGTSNQIFKFNNLFVQDAFGAYEFRGIGSFGEPGYVSPIEAFEQGRPYSYQYSYLLEDGSPRAKFTGMQFGLYVQDRWSVKDNLKLTFGLRADMPLLPEDPTYNLDVPEAFPGYTTSRVASGNILWSPRFGFNWQPKVSDGSTQIRGGAGIFSGTPPFVWISNQYSNTGADYGRIDITRGQDMPEDFRFVADPNNQPVPSQGAVNTTEVNLISKNFKYPQSLKLNAAVDQELPYGITATLEGVYSKAINEVKFTNINLEHVGESAYGRPFYGEVYYNEGFSSASGNPTEVDPRFTNAILLENTDKGYQYSLTGQLRKRFGWGLNASLAYTYNKTATINNGSSSRAISNWQYNENFDVNNPKLGSADYERRHRILGTVGYTFAWAERFKTTFSLIYDGRSGAPFSWIYNGDANGDSRYDNDLVYVPSAQDDIILASNNWEEFNNFIENHPSLDQYRGEVVERGTAREPWTNKLDLRINQEVETVQGQSIEFTASLFNVLNFLNEEWGVTKTIDGYNNYQVYTIEEYDDSEGRYAGGTGRPVISFDPNNVTEDALYYTNDLGSRWQLQLGVRYNF